MIGARGISDYEAMMADAARMKAYQEAIRAVCPGKVVCEIGVGLGALSLMALNAGAERVYGIEAVRGPLEAATEVIRAAGYGPDRFIPIHGLARDAKLDEPIDVLLSETLDHMGIGEDTVAVMNDAKKRLMAPDGVFLPLGLGCFAALASPAAWAERKHTWTRWMPENHGLNYGPLFTHMRRLSYSMDIGAEELYSPWAVWQSIVFNEPGGFQPRRTLLFQAARDGLVEGIAVAFVAFLAPGVELSTLPDAPQTHWRQGFQPLPEPLTLEAGDGVVLEMVCDSTIPGAAALRLGAQRIPRAELPAFVKKIQQGSAD